MKLTTTLLILIFCLYSCKIGKKTESKTVNNTEVKTQVIKKNTTQEIREIKTPEFIDISKIPDSLELENLNLRGDFNGDGEIDFASIVHNKKSKQKGVLIIHDSNEQKTIIFGAGKEINGMKDLDWIEIFKILPKGKVIAPTIVDEETGDILGADEKQSFRLIGNGIEMGVEESCGGGIIFWNGKNYQWYHIE